MIGSFNEIAKGSYNAVLGDKNYLDGNANGVFGNRNQVIGNANLIGGGKGKEKSNRSNNNN